VLVFSTASPPCSPCPSSSPSPNFADPVPDQTNLINTKEILGGGRENKREREGKGRERTEVEDRKGRGPRSEYQRSGGGARSGTEDCVCSFRETTVTVIDVIPASGGGGVSGWELITRYSITEEIETNIFLRNQNVLYCEYVTNSGTKHLWRNRWYGPIISSDL
jgi:hypothetical protein